MEERLLGYLDQLFSAPREAFVEARKKLVAEIAKAALAESGGEANVGQLRRIFQSLQATPFASAEELTRLARGHLVNDLEGPS